MRWVLLGLTIFGANIFKEAGAGMQGKSFDNTADAEALREDLMAIARTTLSSKILTHDKDYFAKIAVDAVMCLKGARTLSPSNSSRSLEAPSATPSWLMCDPFSVSCPHSLSPGGGCS